MFDIVFVLANLYMLPMWALLIFTPGWSWTERIIASLWIFLPLALVYTGMMFVVFTGALLWDMTLPDLMTPAGIARLFSVSEVAAAGWVHYLTFDLFVGRWVYFDSRQPRVNRWLTSIALAFVSFTGPFGLLLYWIVRTLSNRRTS